MLLRTSQLLSLAIMSLQTGEEIAYSESLLIDPDTLQIAALELGGESLDEHPSFLRIEDIRELSSIGFIIDSSDECIGLDDVIAIKELYNNGFQPVDKQVVDETGKKLGKVYDTIFNTDTFRIEQLCVNRPLLMSFGDTELLIRRTQIVDITDKQIVVRSTAIKQTDAAKKKRSQPMDNPFRKPQRDPQPETITAKE